MTSVGADLLSLNALVWVRLSEHDIEYPSRIEDVADDTVVVAAPPGATAALLASGVRNIELSWVSPRGRYEQPCHLIEHIAGSVKRWRLRPVGAAVLVQRRRYVRVRAAIAVLLVLPGDVLTATTIDVSEGGFRLRLARRDILADTPATIQANLGSRQLELTGTVLRAHDVDATHTEAVVTFDADGPAADAIRRFVFQMQLRARAARQA